MPVNISIFVGGSVAHSAVATSAFHCRVVKETEKAVQVKGDNGQTMWLPKAALKPIKSAYADHGLFGLARWFKPDRWQASVIDRNLSVGGISVR